MNARVHRLIVLRQLRLWAAVSLVQGLTASGAAAQTPPGVVTQSGNEVTIDNDAYPAQSKRRRDRFKVGVSYSMAVPVGDLDDFDSGASFRGYDFTVLFPVVAGLHVGPALGFNSFHENKPRSTYQLESGAITGKLYTYTDYWSFTVAGRYLFLSPAAVLRPYAGARLGVAALSTRTLVVDRSRQRSPAGFLMVPELGLVATFSPAVLGLVSGQFSYSTASASGFDDLSFGALQLGIMVQ